MNSSSDLDDTGNEDYESPTERKIPRLAFSKNVKEDSGKEKGKNEKKDSKSKSTGSSSKNSFGQKYLASLGYQEGKGLGKHQDGIVEPVEASKQKGRRGLGFKALDVESAVSKYDPSLEIVSLDEEVEWLNNNYQSSVDTDVLESWVKTGLSLENIDENTIFCDPDLVKNVMTSKNVLDSLTAKEIKNGKSRYNPFETIQKAIFLNRAAMKMANLDAILDRMFTEPKDMRGENIIGSYDLLYFADVCAGPGGFSEYVFYRKKWRAKGFGFTLKNGNDFTLDEFWAGPSETFEPHYGVRDDGNVFYQDNILSFKNHVLKYTGGKGVHFMMADGGVEIAEKFNNQELICKKLYLCQCIVALHIVRSGGHFLVKLFDLFTEFSIGLIYLMYRSFEKILLIKPNTSRPASSERYLVCKWKREDCKDIADHLFKINSSIPLYGNERKNDILEIVPTEILRQDTKFFQYIVSSNDKLAKRQIVALIKLATFSENTDLKDDRQPELRRKSLEKWNIPDIARAEPKKYEPSTTCRMLIDSSAPCDRESDIKKKEIDSLESFKNCIISIHNWYCVVINSEEDHNTCAFYLGLGRGNVWKYSSGRWVKWNDHLNITGLSLPANTLVYGELVQELIGEGRSQRKSLALHIIDGLFLGDEDIRHLPFRERWETCKLFAKSAFKENFPIRVKNYEPLANIDLLKEKLEMKSVKSYASLCVCVPIEENIFWKAGGVIFIRDTKDHWHRFFSCTNQKMYFDNRQSRAQYFEGTPESRRHQIYADFDYSFRNRLVWWWGNGVAIHEYQQIERNFSKMQMDALIDYVNSKKRVTSSKSSSDREFF